MTVLSVLSMLEKWFWVAQIFMVTYHCLLDSSVRLPQIARKRREALKK